VICRVRSGPAEVTRKACARPTGSITKSPGPGRTLRRHRSSAPSPPAPGPSRPRAGGRCSGVAKPGGLTNSTTLHRSPVSSAEALTVTRLPRNHTASPRPAEASGDERSSAALPPTGHGRRCRRQPAGCSPSAATRPAHWPRSPPCPALRGPRVRDVRIEGGPAPPGRRRGARGRRRTGACAEPALGHPCLAGARRCSTPTPASAR
jgi:hypothetical protein